MAADGSGLRHGLAEKSDKKDKSLYTLAPPAGPAVAKAPWNPAFVALFGPTDTAHCDFSSPEQTELSRLVQKILKARFLPILCRYQNNPEDLKYAVMLLNNIAAHLCLSLKLLGEGSDVLSSPPDYRDAVSRYFEASKDRSTPFPVERLHVDPLELNAVDPFNFINETEVEEARVLWANEGSIQGATDSIAASKTAFTSFATQWSSFLYNHYMVQVPLVPVSPDGDLPLELEWTLPPLFDQVDERAFFDQMVYYTGEAVSPPEHAQQIVQEFRQGLVDVMAYLSRVSLPVQSQLLGIQSVVQDPLAGSPYQYVEIGAENHLSRIPTGNLFLEWGSEGIFHKASDQVETERILLFGQFASSAAWEDFAGAFDQEFDKIGQDFREYYATSPAWLAVVDGWEKKYGEKAVEDFLDSLVRDILNEFRIKFYDRWASLVRGVILNNVPMPTLYYVVQQDLISLELRSKQLGGKQDVDFLVPHSLAAINLILHTHEGNVLAQAGAVLGQNPWTIPTVHQVSEDYQGAVWFFDVMANAYDLHVGKKSTSTADLSPAPFLPSALAELDRLVPVFAKANDVLALQGKAWPDCLEGWSEYQNLRQGLRAQDTSQLFTAALFGFLEGKTSAQDFYTQARQKADHKNISLLYRLLQPLLQQSKPLEDGALQHLPPQDARGFVNRLRYAIYYLTYACKLYQVRAKRESLALASIVREDLDRWVKALPLGWPRRDGSTTTGFKGDYSFFPDKTLYLSQTDFYALFDPRATVEEEEVITKLTQFFTNFEDGYYKFFSYGGYQEDVHGKRIKYVRDHVALNQWLLVLQDMYQMAEVKLAYPGLALVDGDLAYVRRIQRIAKQLATNVQSFLNSPRPNDPFWAFMSGDREYTYIVPNRVIHTHDARLDFGPGQEGIKLKAEWLIWQGEHQPRALIDLHYPSFDIVSRALQASHTEEEEPSLVLQALELNLQRLGALNPFDFLAWYRHKARAPEMEYVVGRLYERATGGERADQIPRYDEIKRVLQSTSRHVLKKLSSLIKDGSIRDANLFAKEGFSASAVQLLTSLSPAELLWLSGHLKQWLNLSDRYYDQGETDDIYFDAIRQQEIDDFVFGLTPDEAVALLQDVIQDYKLPIPAQIPLSPLTDQGVQAVIERFEVYFSDPLLTEARGRQEELYLSLNKKNREFNPLEVLYLSLLVSHELFGNPPEAELATIKHDFEENYPWDKFDVDRVKDFYLEVPDSEKLTLYAFAYNLAFRYYRGHAVEYLERVQKTSESSAILDPFGRKGDGNEFWLWLRAKLSTPPDFSVYPNDMGTDQGVARTEFAEGEVLHIHRSWLSSYLWPRMPELADLTPKEFNQVLERAVTSRNFYDKNKVVLQERITALQKVDAERAKVLKATLPNHDELSPKELHDLNLALLALVDERFAAEVRNRRRLVEEADKILARDFGDLKQHGEIKLDIPTQLVLDHVFGELVKNFLADGDTAMPDEAAFSSMLYDILLGPYDADDPLERELYSRYNPNATGHGQGPPPELALIFSRDFFTAQTRLGDPRLLRRVKPVLEDMRQLLEDEASADKVQQIAADSWNDVKALETVYAADYLSYYTLAFYRYHDYERASEVEGRLKEIATAMAARIKTLERESRR